MNKTAEHIAAEVMLKVACQELFKEAGIQRFEGLGSALANKLIDRIGRRVAQAQQSRATKIVEGLVKRFRKAARENRTVAPNTDWYREMRSQDGKEVIGYIAGRGREPITVLAPGMVPRGTFWNN